MAFFSGAGLRVGAPPPGSGGRTHELAGREVGEGEPERRDLAAGAARKEARGRAEGHRAVDVVDLGEARARQGRAEAAVVAEDRRLDDVVAPGRVDDERVDRAADGVAVRRLPERRLEAVSREPEDGEEQDAGPGDDGRASAQAPGEAALPGPRPEAVLVRVPGQKRPRAVGAWGGGRYGAFRNPPLSATRRGPFKRRAIASLGASLDGWYSC